MRQLRYIASLAIMLLAALPMQAQTENQAFYIYQNDGHFDGFFYDEIEKMSFSFLDTLGVEHDEIVSQEIFTADSVYRIMLSAIDSIGFVQPEIKYNPQVHIAGQSFFYGDFQDLSYNEYAEEGEVIYFSKEIVERTKDYYYDEATDKMVHWPLPQVGDVFVDFDKENGGLNGWCAKIDRLYYDEDGYLIGVCKPIDDITDILQQFVAVEEYGYADDGTMVRRRVAGCPELTIGNWNLPKKSTNRAGGQWEGDLFNFSINTHIPLYISDDLTVSVDPSIEGKLHLKTTWNLSLFGDKHISIHSKLNFGVGAGFTVDGKIADFFPGGIGGLLGGVPIPATCPLILLDIAPDAFLRGEAHVNFKLNSPKLNGSIWSTLTINNWVPSIDMGFGNSDDNSKFESVDNSGSRATISLNGFVQTGMLFPMKFKSLPVLKKLFDSEIGGQWFVGPKLAADFTLDLTTMPWEDIAAYNQLKNITGQIHMLDADYEVKGTVKTAFSGKKEVTLADGSISLFPPVDLKIVPEFENCTESYEKHFINIYGEGNVYNCRMFNFKPSGFVFKPVYLGCEIQEQREDGTWDYIISDLNCMANGVTAYFNIAGMLGQELPKEQWARCGIMLEEGKKKQASKTGVFRVRPTIANPFNYNLPSIIATPEYIFEYAKSEIKAQGDTIYTDYDGSNSTAVTMTGTCDRLEKADYLKVTGSKGSLVASFNKEWLRIKTGMSKNYAPVSNLYIKEKYQGSTTTDGEIFITEEKPMTICVKPNTKEDPDSVGFMGVEYGRTYSPNQQRWDWTITRTENGWFCKGIAEYYWQKHECSFNVVDKGGDLVVVNGKYHWKYEFHEDIQEETDSFDDIKLSHDNGRFLSPLRTSNGRNCYLKLYFHEFFDSGKPDSEIYVL